MTRVIVAIGLCSPARLALTHARQALHPYGFRLLGSWVRETDLYHEVTIDFTPQAAKWGEYVLLRSGFRLVSRPLDPRNEGWALRWNGPPKPWLMPGCTRSQRQSATKWLQRFFG